MQIKFVPPPEIEATVKVEDDGTLVIAPRFATSKGSALVGSVVVRGSKGKERRFLITVSGNQGRVNTVEARNVESEFDKLAATAAGK